MVGAKKIFVVIKSLRFFNSMRHVSAAGRGHLGARGTRVKVPGGGGGRGQGEGRRRRSIQRRRGREEETGGTGVGEKKGGTTIGQ